MKMPVVIAGIFYCHFRSQEFMPKEFEVVSEMDSSEAG
jgi:hypothetical protein